MRVLWLTSKNRQRLSIRPTSNCLSIVNIGRYFRAKKGAQDEANSGSARCMLRGNGLIGYTRGKSCLENWKKKVVVRRIQMPGRNERWPNKRGRKKRAVTKAPCLRRNRGNNLVSAGDGLGRILKLVCPPAGLKCKWMRRVTGRSSVDRPAYCPGPGSHRFFGESCQRHIQHDDTRRFCHRYRARQSRTWDFRLLVAPRFQR